MALPAVRTAVVLFTRDLRVHDNPALAAAARVAESVVPLFVLDPLIQAGPNRRRFLAESLADLRESLRQRGAELIVRRGDPVRQAIALAREVGADAIMMAADVSGYAQRRQRRLAEECARHRIALHLHPGVTVVPAGELRPGGGGPAYQVFTPYWRVWQQAAWRPLAPTPRRLCLPDHPLSPGELPSTRPRGGSSATAAGGEAAARRRLRDWLDDLPEYAENHDRLAADGTSRLSPYLRFGCLSPRELAEVVRGTGVPAADDFIRQICWRDFFHQVTAVFPQITRDPLRGEAWEWRTDPDALAAWQSGRTGLPIIDAGMRQLAEEGWLHNRARLLVGSFLAKDLGLDWRAGAAWFARWLLDGDVPNNYGNWQWVAGTGNDRQPYRRFNPIRQAHRFDPAGDYVRRYLPELAGVSGGVVHEPWRLPATLRRALDYPAPIAVAEPADPGGRRAGR